MAQAKSSPFSFKGYTIQESHILRKPVLQKGKFDIKVTPFGQIDKKKKLFQLDLIVEASELTGRFNCKVHCIGFFEFKNVVDKTTLSNYFYVNAPAILFPYIRAYIAALTSLSGIEAIHIPTLNMTKLKKELEEKTIEV